MSLLAMQDNSKQSDFSFFLQFYKKHIHLFFIALPIALIIALIPVAQALIAGDFVEKGLFQKNMDMVKNYSFLIVIVFVVDGISNFIYKFCIRMSMEKTVKDTRDFFFKKYIALSKSLTNTIPSGKITNHLLSDMFVLSFFSNEIINVFSQPLKIIVIFGFLFYTSWKLTLICLLTLPFVLLITKYFGKKNKKNQENIQEALEDITIQVHESTSGLQTAQIFGRLGTLYTDFKTKNEHHLSRIKKLIRIEESVSPTIKVFTTFVAALVAYFGGYLVETGEMSAGKLTTYFTAGGLMLDPLRKIGHINVKVQEFSAVLHRLRDFINIKTDAITDEQAFMLENPTTTNTKNSFTHLKAQNIHYTHNQNDKDAFKLTIPEFEFKAGQRIAFVGQSGSGKSTFSHLILRLLDPVQGTLLLNNKKVSDYDLKSYRSHFSYVSQNPFLFNKTLKENLLFAKSSATDEELKKVIQQAQLDQLVNSWPEGINTVIAPQSSSVSGGEKQRIAIARAILKDSPVIIFDEATSQLDSENETLIAKALNDLAQNKSIISIAHRLSTTKDYDHIYVFENGKIIEQGTPGDLLSQDTSTYKKLYDLQSL